MIYIYTFGSKVLKVANSTPLEVGAENRDNFLYDLKDNSGVNISDQNEYFGELSGMYWVWKNCKQYSPIDIIGFVHYNKGFQISDKSLKSIIGGAMDYLATRKEQKSSRTRRGFGY